MASLARDGVPRNFCVGLGEMERMGDNAHRIAFGIILVVGCEGYGGRRVVWATHSSSQFEYLV